ncbi:MAG: TetR/AcrR family transcriptional regulator [Bacteroidota bacterium]
MALGKKEWLEEGFKLLSEFAQDKLTMQYLCKRLGVTRGSFYHHFKGIEDYVQKMMEKWEEENTQQLVEISNQGKSPIEAMEILAQSISLKNQVIEAAIRSWSFYHPVVGTHVQKVDQIRLQHLTHIFIEMGVSKERANLRAKLDYGTLVGIQLLFPKITKTEMEQLWTEQRTMLHTESK